MDVPFLAIEPPIELSEGSNEGLKRARERLHQEKTLENNDSSESLNVLERAWLESENKQSSQRGPLSARLGKLWAERGDFSRFHASRLRARVKEEEAERAQSDSKFPELESDYDLGVNLGSQNRDNEGAPEETEGQKGNEKKSLSRQTEVGRDVMSIQDMVTLRAEMLENLNTARNSLYFSHALVSLLLNSNKVDQSVSSSHLTANRAGTPSSSAGGPSKGGVAPSVAGGRSSASMHVMGNVQNLEQELGIEANVFGASKIQGTFKEKSREHRVDDEEGEEEGEESDEEYEDLQRELEKNQRADTRLSESEAEEKARELVESYEGKRDGLKKAADILMKGSRSLQWPSDGANASQNTDRMRWAVLQEARQGGWGLVPGKPIRVKDERRELLPEDQSRRKDEAARDAWIGYSIPEAHTNYQRRALAYFSYGAGPFPRPVDALCFAARPRRSLEIRIVVQDDQAENKTLTWTSQREGWGGSKSKESESTTGVEAELKQAQKELADVELYDVILSECRVLSSNSLARVTIHDAHSTSLELNSRTQLHFNLVEIVSEDDNGNEVKSNDDSPINSPIASTILASLQLGLIKIYRQRAGIHGGGPAVSSMKRPSNASQSALQQAPLLRPILGCIHYASFVAKLQDVLHSLLLHFEKTTMVKGEAALRYDFGPLNQMANTQTFLSNLLQGDRLTEEENLRSNLGGQATVYLESRPIAFLDIVFPSRLCLTLPLRKSALGVLGIQLKSIDLASLKEILVLEIARLTDRTSMEEGGKGQ